MQVHQTMYMYAEERWDGKIEFNLYPTDMSEYGWMLIGHHDVTFEVPDNFDVRQAKLKTIEKEMAKLRASFQARITELQAQYNECLAIENGNDGDEYRKFAVSF